MSAGNAKGCLGAGFRRWRWFSAKGDLPKALRTLMRDSLEAEGPPPSENLNETVLIYLQQKTTWPPSLISYPFPWATFDSCPKMVVCCFRESVSAQKFDSRHGAYSLLHEKLLRTSSELLPDQVGKVMGERKRVDDCLLRALAATWKRAVGSRSRAGAAAGP